MKHINQLDENWSENFKSLCLRVPTINASCEILVLSCLRRFFMPKIWSFKTSSLQSLRVDKRIKLKKQALPAPATCTMINGLHKRVMAFFASCEQFRYSKRFDCWNENISILTHCMCGGLGHGERCSYVQN
jgi:hypothetical protein